MGLMNTLEELLFPNLEEKDVLNRKQIK